MPLQTAGPRSRRLGGDYPDGQLRTSVSELARFLAAIINEGELDGVRILRSDTVAEMRRRQIPDLDPDQELVWAYYDDGRSTYLGHEGGDDGVATTMWYRIDAGVGVIVLTNGDWDHSGEAIYDIESRIWAEAGRFGLE